MRNKLNVQKKMILRHYWLKDIMPLSKKSILMATLLSLGLVTTADVYAAKDNQTHIGEVVASTQAGHKVTKNPNSCL